MRKNKIVTEEERKTILLDMLKEIDTVCKTNNLKYSLAFGTLLGAIRHKGFIPWDDDLDIMMPLEDMRKLKDVLRSENIRYCDVDTEPYYEFDFSRIAHNATYSNRGRFTKGYGISIDLYPVIRIPREEQERDNFFFEAEKIQKRRLSFIKWNGKIVRNTPFHSIPGFKRAVRALRDYLLKERGYDDGLYYIVAAPFSRRDKDTYDFDLFREIKNVEFEGNKYAAISDYDYFLKHIYGDYMTPPPLDQQQPYHFGTFFWK